MTSTATPRVLFVSGSGSGNTLRYRVRYAEEALRGSGVRTGAVHFSEPRLASWVAEADVVVLYRTPASRRVLDLVQHVRTRTSARLSFDIDDRVFLPKHNEHIPFLDSLGSGQRRAFIEAVESRGRVVPYVDYATASTSPIVDDLRGLTGAPVSVLPNGVSQSAKAVVDGVARSTDPSRVRIGYFSGSATHDADWAIAEAAVVDVLREHSTAELWLVGPLAVSSALSVVADQVRTIDFVPWRELPALLAAVDVNISPLDLTPFTEAKSAIKWLEAAAVGTPTVATLTRPFLDAVVDGHDALLVADPAEWRATLARVVTDSALRRDLGAHAKEAALTRFGPEVQRERYSTWLRNLMAADRLEVDMAALRELRGSEPPVRHLGSRLQPYEFPAGMTALVVPAPRAARAVDALRQASQSLRTRTRRYRAAVIRRVRRVTGRSRGHELPVR